MSIFELGGVVGSGMPLIGWHNFATPGNSTVWDQTGDINDASGAYGHALWDGTTYTKWRNEPTGPAGQPAGDILITTYGVTGLGVNYMALAAHNFGTLGITASIEAASDTTSYPDRSPSSLLHFENTGSPDVILDSTGRHTWTAVGNAFQDTAQFKFGTRSLRLDGAGDYIRGDGSIDFAFGTGDFTIDLWVRFNSLAGQQQLIGVTAGTNIDWILFKDTPSNTIRWWGNGALRITGTTAVTTGTWFHLAVARSSGITRLYVNGVQEGSDFADTISYTAAPSQPVIGIASSDLTSSGFNGWIDEVRVVKGHALNSGTSPDVFPQQTAAYANEFVRVGDSFTFTDDTPAIIRFPDSDDYTAVRLRLHSGAYEDDPVNGVTGTLSSLLPFNGTDGSTTITDLTGHVWTVNGNAQIDTSGYRFGGSSLLLDGSGDFITGDGSAAFAFGTGDFTVDFWVMFNALGAFANLWDCTDATTANRFWMHKADDHVFEVSSNGAVIITGTTVVITNVWYHVAATRSGTSTRLFVNGVQEGSTATDSVNYTIGTSRPILGAYGGNTSDSNLNGWLDSVRVIKGRAKWTANFAVPTRGIGFEAEELYAGVQYVGNILELERSIDVNVDHVPMPYGRRTTVINGMSETGQFLGRVVLGEWRESKATFKWFTPDHYRADIDAFLEAAQETPFFWAWHPNEYPAEVSFVWLVNNAEPETDPVTQRVHLELDMRGTAS